MCRDVVNPVYAVLIRAILSAIHRISALDAKHGVRLSLENYKQFESILRGSEEQNPVLAFFIKTTEEQKEKALKVCSLKARAQVLVLLKTAAIASNMIAIAILLLQACLKSDIEQRLLQSMCHDGCLFVLRSVFASAMHVQRL